jgi:KDEL-tailed cysteine endopeptidase
MSQTKAALATQVLSVSIEADRAVFQQYSTGIFDSTKCGTNLDHAVALVGYGTSPQPYYILRNSWGTSWGEQGYMKIAMVDGAGICGVQMEPLYPASN